MIIALEMAHSSSVTIGFHICDRGPSLQQEHRPLSQHAADVRGGAARVLVAVNGGATMDGDYEEYDVRATVRFQF